MRKGKTLIGKDVLSLADGAKLNTVKDVIIGQENDEIVALLVDEGGLLSSSQVVPVEAIQSFGKDAVVIANSRAVVPASRYPRVNEILNRKDSLMGKRVFTEMGEQKGSISDMYFDEGTGRILGFEVSGGLVNNVASGKSYLPVEDITRMGPDVVYIQEQAAEGLDSQKGGLQGALQSAQEKTGEMKDRAGQAVSDAQAGDEMDPRPPEEIVLGRTSNADIEDDNGNVIVAAGQRIGPQEVERARMAGKQEALYSASGMVQVVPGQGGGIGADADVSGTVQQAGDAAGGLWDSFTRKIGEMTDATGKRMDEQQTKKRLADIEDAVGRPVTKVMLDRRDNVILNLGDLITHEAVQRSHEAGSLDSLLGSVYKGDVSFSKEEMKAKQEGQAVVERATGAAPLIDEMQQKLEQADQERQQTKEQQKAEADQQREQREQERQQRAQEREAALQPPEPSPAS